MITNEQMKPNRFALWANSRKIYNAIIATLQNHGIVTIATHHRATHYDHRHISMFKYNRIGAYVQRGKHWDCINYCAIRHYRTPS